MKITLQNYFFSQLYYEITEARDGNKGLEETNTQDWDFEILTNHWGGKCQRRNFANGFPMLSQ